MADDKVVFDLILKDLFSNSISNATSQINKLNNSLKSTKAASEQISTMKMAVGSFLGSKINEAVNGIWDLGKGIIKLGLDAEQTQIAFETMMGSSELATKHIADMKKMAATTPYELEPLLEGSRMLQQYGMDVKQAVPMMSMLGDVASGNAEKMKSLTYAMAQINAAGVLQGQDLRQLIDAGFNPLQIMSEKTGKSMKKLKDEMSDGAITSDMVTQAFIEATSAGGKFYNMSEKQSKTVAGRISTMIDDFKEIGRVIGASVLPALGWLVDHSKTLAKSLAVLTIAFVAYKTAMVVSSLMTLGFTGIFAALNAVMLLNPIVLVVAALAALTLAFIWAWDNSEGFRGAMYGIWEVTKQVGENIYNYLLEPLKAFSQIWQGLQDVFNGKGFDNLIAGFIRLGRTMLDYLLQPLLQAVKLVDKVAGTDYASGFKSIMGMNTDITAGTGNAFDKGMKEGVASFKDKKEGLTINKQDALKTSVLGMGGSGNQPGGEKLKGEVDKIKSNQPSNVYINIDTLVKVDNIGISNASNPKSDMGTFLTQLEEALLTVVNDVNYVLK